MSSIKAPVNVRLLAEDYHLLAETGRLAVAAIAEVKGLTSINSSWDRDFTEAQLEIDANRALAYGITLIQIAAQLPLTGIPISLNGNLVSIQTLPVRLYFNSQFDAHLQGLRLIPIWTAKGPVPLEALGKIRYELTANKIERNNLLYSLDISGDRSQRAISTLTEGTVTALEQAGLQGVSVHQKGNIKQMEDSFGWIFKAIGIGIILLLVALIAIYQSRPRMGSVT